MDWRGKIIEELQGQLSIEPSRIPVVILSAIGIYIAFLVLTRLFGSRVLTSMSASDAVVIIMFGAVAGRVIIGHPPTLAAGIIGLATLMLLEAIFGEIRRKFGWSNFLDRRPILLIFAGRYVSEGMRFGHMAPADVLSALRRAGVGSKEEVGAMVLEPTGHISVIKRGQPIDPEILENTIGFTEIANILREKNVE